MFVDFSRCVDPLLFDPCDPTTVVSVECTLYRATPPKQTNNAMCAWHLGPRACYYIHTHELNALCLDEHNELKSKWLAGINPVSGWLAGISPVSGWLAGINPVSG
jgi:hypothetical protein